MSDEGKLGCPLCGGVEFEEHEYVLTIHPAWFEGDAFELDGQIGSEVDWEAAKDATVECRGCGAEVELVGEGTDEPRLVVSDEAALAWARAKVGGEEAWRRDQLVALLDRILEATR